MRNSHTTRAWAVKNKEGKFLCDIFGHVILYYRKYVAQDDIEWYYLRNGKPVPVQVTVREERKGE